jgi:hypothetical protein
MNPCLHKVGVGNPRCPCGVRLRGCPVSASGAPFKLSAIMLDHARFWLTADRMRFATAEPYTSRIDDHGLATMTELAAEIGLVMDRSDNSPYYPGKTVLLTFCPKGYSFTV